MSARSEIADALASVLPEARVIGYAKTIDNMPVGQPVVMVYRENVIPSGIGGTRTETIVVWVATNVTDPEKADDTLDPFLDTVLDVLEGRAFAPLVWSEALREALADTYPAYKITTTIQTKKE